MCWKDVKLNQLAWQVGALPQQAGPLCITLPASPAHMSYLQCERALTYYAANNPARPTALLLRTPLCSSHLDFY